MLEDLRNERIKKLELLRKRGVDPYPAVSQKNTAISVILNNFEKLEKSKTSVIIAGRLMSLREHGGIVFCDLYDESGKIQILLKKENLTDSHDFFLSVADTGDFIECSGTCFKTKRGEMTLEVFLWTMLAKSLRPLPEKWHGLQDVEERYRKRYLDMVMNSDVKSFFVKKAQFWKSARQFLQEEGFLEVETPVLEANPGGADAEPFLTHMNALDIDLYLRIAPELSLKRLIVGGFEKVFEIGRIFRNEGIDREHLQDYTQLEFYWAYADYQKLKIFVQNLYRKIIFETLGSFEHQWEGKTIDWEKEWKEYDYYELMKEKCGVDLSSATDAELRSVAKKRGLDPEKHMGRGRVIDLIFKKVVKPTLIEPGFLINPPVDVEPLAKRLETDANRVQRIQIVACGTELGKGFSELNDPLDQRARMEEGLKLREAGDKEAQRMDEDFLEALEYGMPPTAGFGFSERLFAVIMEKSVREITLFPLMRPK